MIDHSHLRAWQMVPVLYVDGGVLAWRWLQWRLILWPVA